MLESAAHTEENWNALLKTMVALDLQVPKEYRIDDVDAARQVPTPTTGTTADKDLASERAGEGVAEKGPDLV